MLLPVATRGALSGTQVRRRIPALQDEGPTVLVAIRAERLAVHNTNSRQLPHEFWIGGSGRFLLHQLVEQADRVVQFLLKGRRNRFSMYAACQQYVVVKRGHRPLLIGAKFGLVHVGAHRDGTFQRIEGFLRLFAAHHF